MTKVLAPYKLDLPSTPSSISCIEEFVKKIVTRHNISQDKFPDILISLTEAVNNAIIHGNKSNIKKKVEVKMSKVKAGISIVVSDEGKGFNPRTIPDPTKGKQLECCGGRGVHIIKELCDQVSFLNEGRTIEMIFCVDPK